MSTLRHLALVIGGICSSVAVVLSAYGVSCHLVSTRHVALKSFTIRIILMVPIYAAEAILGIQWSKFSLVLAVFRSSYESFALFSFVQLMLAYLTLDAPSQGDGAKGAIWVALDIQDDTQVTHLVPCCLMKPWPMGPTFLRRSLTGVFQYTIVMPFVTFLTAIFQYSGGYGDDLSDFTSAYPYLAVIQNGSQCWALYCLVLFYKATSSRLQPIRPLNKFLCIKMVVFVTWWQDMLIEILVHFNVIRSVDLDGHGASSAEDVASLLSNFIICLEMMFMAAVFCHSFPPSDYIQPSSGRRGRRYLLHNPDSSFLGDTLIMGGPQSNMLDPESSPWEEAGKLHNEHAAAHFAKDLVRSVAVFDVLEDMKTMAKLGKNDRLAPNGGVGVSSSIRVGETVTFQERMFGRKRTKKHPKFHVEKEVTVDFQSKVNDEGVILFDGRTDQEMQDEMSRDLFDN